MELKSFSGRQWVMVVVGVLIVGTVVFGLRAGYLPEIGKFFAYDPGYVPVCGWHGEPITPASPQCCAAFMQVPVSVGRITPTPLGTPIDDKDTAPVASSDTTEIIALTSTPTPLPPTAYYPDYCVVPGCTAVARQVQCFKAPCNPVVEIVCPSGVVPPPRPSYPPPTPAVVVRIDAPNGGETFAATDAITVMWYSSPLPQGYYFQLGLRSVATNMAQAYYHVEPSAREFTFNWELVDELRRAVPAGQDEFIAQVYVVADGSSTPDIDPPLTMDGSDAPFIIKPSDGPTPTVLPSSPPYGYVGLSIRPESGDTGSGAIEIRPGIPMPIQLYVSSNPANLGLTAAELVVQTSSGLELSTFAPGDLTEILKPAEISHIPNGPSQLKVVVGSGTTPVSGAPILGTVIVTAAKDASGFFDLNLMGDTRLTAAGNSNNVLGGFSPRRFRVVAGGIPGDANGDGKVDIFDYNIVVTEFGKSGSNLQGDLDGNGIVDIFDYNLVVSNFGR